MNAVLQACVHCGDIDSAIKVFDEMSKPEGCGVDDVTYATLLKGLGDGGRIDEAFQVLESVEKGCAFGSPKLSPMLIFGLLNALIEAGDLRRANGLLARYGFVLCEEGNTSTLICNLLMKGYISIGSYQTVSHVHNEMLRQGLAPDKVTYNTLIFACVNMQKMDAALHFFNEMKDRDEKFLDGDLFPDIFTFTTLIKGFGDVKDLSSVEKIFTEMKCCPRLVIDRVAYTATVDALLNCGSVKGALCVFGEIIKRAGPDPRLRPKPHLYVSLMRAFAHRGGYDMVKNLQKRMWLETVGTISSETQKEADNLLVEAALNEGQLGLAVKNLKGTMKKWKELDWNSRGGMVAIQIEALLGFTGSLFSPRLITKISVHDSIEHIMVPFEKSRPLKATLKLKQVVMRFYQDLAVPVIDDWGSCVGILQREDCNKLDDPLSSMMKSPPPYVFTSTSLGRAVDLMLEKRYRMVIIVRYSELHSLSYGSSLRAVGVLNIESLLRLYQASSQTTGEEFCLCRNSM